MVEPDALRDLDDVRTDRLTDVRYLVDEQMRVIRNAFAASLIISAEATSVRTIGASIPL